MNDQSGSDGANQSQRNEAIPPDPYAARVTGNRETLAKLMQEFELDVGCRPHPEVKTDPTRQKVGYDDLLTMDRR